MKTNYVIEEDRFTVLYNASLTFIRPRVPTEHWPGTEEVKDISNIPDDQAQSGLRLVSGRGYSHEDDTDAEEHSDQDDDIEDDYVRETWEYVIDDADFEPRRDVSYEYYQDCEHIYTVSINGNPRQMLMLSEDVEEDIVLGDKDASLFTTYSDFDIEMIKAIVAFDFTRVRQMLDSLGIHYPMPDPYQELIYEDIEDEPDGND